MSTEPVELDHGWIGQALLLSGEAGWNQTAADWAVFMTHGTVLGLMADDRLVATAAILPYGGDFGWISMMLVTPQWRGRGIATRLIGACIQQLRATGHAPFLDATPAGVPVYERLGFVPLCGVQRWRGAGGGREAPGQDCDRAHDRAVFGADRGFLLDNIMARPGSRCFSTAHDFAVLRHGAHALQLGPIVADADTGAVLLTTSIEAADGTVVVDVLEAGYALLPGLAALGFSEQRRFTRMALGRSGLPGAPARLLAAAAPEYG